MTTNEKFLVHFYKILYLQRDNYDITLYKFYLGFLKTYFERDFEHNNEDFLFQVIINLNSFSVKSLYEFYETHSEQWVSIKTLYGITKEQNGIDYDDINFKIHNTLIEFIRQGIFAEKHNIYAGPNSSGYIEIVKVSSLGRKILELIKIVE